MERDNMILIVIAFICMGVFMSIQSDININTNPVNNLGNAVIVEDILHYETEIGQIYKTVYFNESVPNNENTTILIKTNGKESHLIRYLITADDTPDDILLYENATVTANGTEIIPVNYNRKLNITATTQIFSGGTITNYGTLLDREFLTTTKNAGGKSGELPVHWILQEDTYYAIVFANRGGSFEEVLFEIIFYETP